MKGTLTNRDGEWLVEFSTTWDNWAIPAEVPMANDQGSSNWSNGTEIDFRLAYCDTFGKEFDPMKESCTNCEWYGKIIKTENGENCIP